MTPAWGLGRRPDTLPQVEGSIVNRRVGIVAAMLLVMAGCGDPDSSATSSEAGVASVDADEVVAAAVEGLLDAQSFRSRTTGELPFQSTMDAAYEQSGDDVLDISVLGRTGSATVVVDDVAHEWDGSEQSWRTTPLDSYDPLLGPGFIFGMSLLGLFDHGERTDSGGEVPEADDGWPPAATGWTEIDGAGDGNRRFERVLAAEEFLGGDVYEDAPVERLEEDAVTSAFYELARITSTVEVDRDGRISANRIRFEFDGDPDHPDCAPLSRVVGSTEMVVEFSDVDGDVEVRVPTPAELVAEFPELSEAPDYSDDDLDGVDEAFRGPDGERDLSGCPQPT